MQMVKVDYHETHGMNVLHYIAREAANELYNCTHGSPFITRRANWQSFLFEFLPQRFTFPDVEYIKKTCINRIVCVDCCNVRDIRYLGNAGYSAVGVEVFPSTLTYYCNECVMQEELRNVVYPYQRAQDFFCEVLRDLQMAYKTLPHRKIIWQGFVHFLGEYLLEFRASADR